MDFAKLTHLKDLAENLKKRAKTPLLEGKNKLLDRVVVRVFDTANEAAKFLSTERYKKKVYDRLMKYLLSVQPGYEAAQPLLGSVEDEKAFCRYKLHRLLTSLAGDQVQLTACNAVIFL